MQFDQVCGEHFNKAGHSQLDMLPILEEVTHKNDDFLGLEREKIWIRNYHTTNILEPFFILFANCSFFKKGLITFHFSKHVFIFKMRFRMSFHFQNMVLSQNVLSFS